MLKPRNSSVGNINTTAVGLQCSEQDVILDLQFNYVRMPKKLEVLDLPTNLSHHV